jgi:hypothetical protein
VKTAGGWVMAAKGNGYVALTATGGVEMVHEGPVAQREVRAAAESVWLVQMGRAAHDGTFAQFAEKVMALPLSLQESKLYYTSARSESIRFDGQVVLAQAFWVDDVAQPLHGFPHLASIYGGVATLPATSVDIQYQEHLMRLDFSAPQLSSPSQQT